VLFRNFEKINKWYKLIFETWLIRKRRHWNFKLLLKKCLTHIMYKWTSSLQKLFVKCWWNWPQTSKIGRKYQKLFCCRNSHDFIRLFFVEIRMISYDCFLWSTCGNHANFYNTFYMSRGLRFKRSHRNLFFTRCSIFLIQIAPQ